MSDRSESTGNLKNLIMFPAGCHGHLLEYLMDCHEEGRLLPSPFTGTGNSHAHRPLHSRCVDMVFRVQKDIGDLPDAHRTLGVTCADSNLSYATKCYVDRGGHYGSGSGLREITQDFNTWSGQTFHHGGKEYRDFFVRHFGHDGRSPVTRFMLRNYFIFQFVAAPESLLIKTSDLCAQAQHTIPVDKILDYSHLKQWIMGITGVDLDFRHIHDEFLGRNRPLALMRQEDDIFHAVIQGKEMPIPELDVVTEASLCHRIEAHYFEVPVVPQEIFYTNTTQIINYIKHFPSYLKRPNRLFEKYYKKYQRRNTDVE